MGNVVTKRELSDTELKLTKEIEGVRLETEKVRGEIKELDLKLSKEIRDSKFSTIKWLVGLFLTQTVALAGLIFTAFRVFGN